MLEAVVKSGAKLIDSNRSNTPLLFNLGADPGEQQNIAGRDASAVYALEQELLEHRQKNISHPMAGIEASIETVLDEETRQRLEALGYGQADNREGEE